MGECCNIIIIEGKDELFTQIIMGIVRKIKIIS